MAVLALLVLVGMSCTDSAAPPARESEPDSKSTAATLPEASATPGTQGGPSPTVQSPQVPEQLRLAIEAYASQQGWRLVGPCPVDWTSVPDDWVGAYCFHQPDRTDGAVRVAVARMFSGYSRVLTLRESSSGGYVITHVEDHYGE